MALEDTDRLAHTVWETNGFISKESLKNLRLVFSIWTTAIVLFGLTGKNYLILIFYEIL